MQVERILVDENGAILEKKNSYPNGASRQRPDGLGNEHPRKGERRRTWSIKPVFGFLLIAVLTAGCVSKGPTKVNPSIVNWSERVGTYTYAEALSQLGKPAAVTESESGITGEWVLKRRSRMSLGLGVGSFGPHTGVGVGTDMPLPSHGENLRLQFGSDGKLSGWSKVKY